MIAWSESNYSTVSYVDMNGRILVSVHSNAVMFHHVVEQKKISDAFRVVPHGEGVIAKIALFA